MLIVYVVLSSALLVFAQMQWKIASQNIISDSKISYQTLILFSTNINFLVGALLYMIATALYLYSLSKYPFHSVQSVLVSTSLVLSYALSFFVFHEKLDAYALLGIILISIGIFFIVK